MRSEKVLTIGFCIFIGLLASVPVWAQTRPVVIQGRTLIDGTGREAVEDAAIVFHHGCIQEVGKRGQVTFTTIRDAKKKAEIDMDRMTGSG